MEAVAALCFDCGSMAVDLDRMRDGEGASVLDRQLRPGRTRGGDESAGLVARAAAPGRSARDPPAGSRAATRRSTRSINNLLTNEQIVLIMFCVLKRRPSLDRQFRASVAPGRKRLPIWPRCTRKSLNKLNSCTEVASPGVPFASPGVPFASPGVLFPSPGVPPPSAGVPPPSPGGPLPFPAGRRPSVVIMPRPIEAANRIVGGALLELQSPAADFEAPFHGWTGPGYPAFRTMGRVPLGRRPFFAESEKP